VTAVINYVWLQTEQQDPRQRRIQAELAQLRFKVSARTVAKYLQRTHRRGPSTTWRSFLRQHGSEIWACDFFCVQTITFRILYVFFVIHYATRQIRHVHVPYIIVYRVSDDREVVSILSVAHGAWVRKVL
jgi:hypothetical protein